MNKTILSIIVVLLLLLGAYFILTSGDKGQVQDNTNQKETVIQGVDNSGLIQNEDNILVAGSYQTYSSEKIALAENEKVVLFFHASWCPSCRAINTDIENNLNNIPAKLNILKVDYDKETELKKKYGVTYQHTFVQVDKDGNLIKKWSGGQTLSSIVSQVQ